MEIRIPTEWEDVTIEMYLKLRPILQTEQSEATRVINILCVLTGEKREVIRDLELKDYHKIIEKLKFLHTELPKKLKSKYFKIGDSWYTFKFDARQLLFGEYVSAMEILQEANNNDEVIFNNLHRLLTAICRPVKRKWFRWVDEKVDGEKIREINNNIYKNMPITLAYPIGVFFYNHLDDLTKNTKISLMQKATKMIKKASKETALLKDGDGGR